MTSTVTAGPFEQLGPRALRRAAPRLGPVLGGAGAAVAFLGLVILAFDASKIDEGDGDSNKMLGALLCGAGVAGGYALMAAFRAGGLATFGSVVAVLLLPVTLFFLTFDETEAPPFSVDVVLMLSVAGWLLGYMIGPARGRPVFLGAAATGLWLFLLEQVESPFTAPFGFVPVPAPFEEGPSSSPDAGTIGLVCLIFAALYLFLAFVLDGRGLHGMVAPLLAVGFLAMAVGFATVQDDLEAAGAGTLLVAAGVVIVLVATRLGRRGSSWLGGAAVAFGTLWIIADAFEDNESAIAPGITLMIVGAAIALAGDRWAAAMDEPSELALPVGGGAEAGAGVVEPEPQSIPEIDITAFQRPPADDEGED